MVPVKGTVQEAGLSRHLLSECGISDLQASTQCIFTDVSRSQGHVAYCQDICSRQCQEVTSWMLTINRKALGGSIWYSFELDCDEHSNKGLETAVKR